MKFHHYLLKLNRILLVWSEFYIYSEKQAQFHFLICHKIFWAYFRQGLLKKEFKVAFSPMLTKYPSLYLSFLHSLSVINKKYFDKDNYVEQILDKCGFSLFEKDTTKKTNYYFREER